jgi:hypothetical protein
MELTKNDAIELAKAAKNGKIEVIVRNGEAPILLAPPVPIKKEKLRLDGNIDTVHNFLSIRHGKFDATKCNIEVRPEKLMIIFKGNEQSDDNDHYTIIVGQMTESKELKKLNNLLNGNFTPNELARELRKIQNLFQDPTQFDNIWKNLTHFKASVDKQIEKLDMRDGNAIQSVKQEVVHNLPKTFNLRMPVIKGADPITFEIQIDVEYTDLSCSLFTTELDINMEAQANALLNAELEKDVNGKPMKEFCVTYFS